MFVAAPVHCLPFHNAIGQGVFSACCRNLVANLRSDSSRALAATALCLASSVNCKHGFELYCCIYSSAPKAPHGWIYTED
jgi:hypothetical protein